MADQLSRAIQDLGRAWSMRHIWFFQAYHAISAKYRRSVLGPFWMAGSMVATSLALSIVFGAIFGQSLHDTLPYVMAGIMMWSIVSMPLVDGPEAFVTYGAVIRSHNFPFMYYIFEGICKNFINFLHNMLVYVVLLFIIGAFYGIHWSFIFAMPVVIIIVAIYSSLVGMLAARFRDIRFLFPYVAQLIFFMTPLFWKPSALPGARRLIVELNPFYHLLEIMRQPLLGAGPNLSDWLVTLFILAVGVLLWLIFFSAFRRRIAFWV